ncbi:MAG: RNA methyltransferase [Dactylosporangium sp.]|nr:RNA methyltransferase [Dactylosporangium sp.]NNJ61531.1 RNA methyltransferase [Dactylosporangium sp.]
MIRNRAWAAGAGEGPAAHCVRGQCYERVTGPGASCPSARRTVPAVDDERTGHDVGVGPWPGPWPTGAHYDPELLAAGDRRNVVDRYRYWRLAAIVADLDARRHDFHVAIENWQHDFNIGTVVRNANAFLAAEVHIVGRRRWNRRGAMVTDRYQHIRYHPDADDLLVWARGAGLPLVGIDNLPGAVQLERATLPRRCVLVFGQEGPGLSEPVRQACAQVFSIAQYGSTRSINAGVASGIAMHAWIRVHAGEYRDEVRALPIEATPPRVLDV